MVNLEAYTAYYIKFIFAHKVVNLIYGACRAVFDRQYAVAAKPVLFGCFVVVFVVVVVVFGLSGGGKGRD